MKAIDSEKLWEKVLEALEDKLQFGILEQARSVVRVQLQGSELLLTCANPEAAEFFNAHVNQQRLILLTRGLANIEKITTQVAVAEPLKKA